MAYLPWANSDPVFSAGPCSGSSPPFPHCPLAYSLGTGRPPNFSLAPIWEKVGFFHFWQGQKARPAEHNPDGHALLRGHAMGEGGGRADFSAPNPNTQLQPLNPGPPGPRCAMLSSVCPDMAAAPSSPACSASHRPGPGRLEASLCTQILSATPIPIPDTCTYSGTLFHALVSPLVRWLQCCLGCRWAMKRASTPWKIKKSPHGSDTQDCKPQV